MEDRYESQPKAHTLPSRTSRPAIQNLAKSVLFQPEKREILKNAPPHRKTLKMKTKTKGKIKHELTTLAIRNAGFGANLKLNEH